MFAKVGSRHEGEFVKVVEFLAFFSRFSRFVFCVFSKLVGMFGQDKSGLTSEDNQS